MPSCDKIFTVLVRPIPRYRIVLVKYLACVLIGGAMILISLILCYGILALGSSSKLASSDIVFLLHSGSILLLGLLVYSALFLLFGGILRHPMVLGLLFVFGWEKFITYVPGNVRLLTVMNYLQTLYPTLSSSKLIHLPPISSGISDVTAIIVLCLLLLLFGGISLALLSIKEYPLDAKE